MCYTYVMESIHQPIVLSVHASEQAQRRGAEESEIREVIHTTPWKPAELGRLECQQDRVFNAVWNGVGYKTKRIRPIFVEEGGRIVVITVYVYYF